MASKTEEEKATDEANRLIWEWLTTGSATLQNGRTLTLDEDGVQRLAMDLAKRAPRKRSMTVNPDDLRPQKTAVEKKP